MTPTHADLCALAAEAHAIAVSRGTYKTEPRWAHLLMLIQAEFHKANERLLLGFTPDRAWCDSGPLAPADDGSMLVATHNRVVTYDPRVHGAPSGFLAGIALACIRALDAITYAKGRPLIVPPIDANGRAALERQTAEEFAETALHITADMNVRDLSDVVLACLEWCEAHKLPLWPMMRAAVARQRVVAAITGG